MEESEVNASIEEVEVGERMSSEEERVLGGLIHHAASQSTFEKQTLTEIAATSKPSSSYPLDPRSLEFTGPSMQKKRKRLSASGVGQRSSSKSSRCLTRRQDVDSTTEVEVEETLFQCPKLLWEKLYDFQRKGVKFLLSKFTKNTGGLLADEMGLGKTIQVVSFLACIASTFEFSDPALIIAPTTLVTHWEDEFVKWNIAPNLIQVNRLDKGVVSRGVVVVSYEAFREKVKNNPSILNHVWSVVVLDEAQRIRNPDAKITLAVKRLNCYCRIALSGSPIQNNLSELWSIFDFVSPGRLGTLPTFQEELAIPIELGTKPRASLQAVQLSYRCAVLVRDLTAPLMLRRLKADFAEELELADKEEQVLFCQLSNDQIELYCKFLSTETVRQASRIDKTNRSALIGKAFYAISVLRKISNHPDLLLNDEGDIEDFGNASRSGKLAVLIPLLKLWHKQGKRCLVFSQSLGMLDILGRLLGSLEMSFNRMDGSTPIGVRGSIVDSFDASKSSSSSTRVFCLLLSTRVGGVGLNLTGAERVVIFDPDWNPMTDAQARERSWRIGQKKNVKIYRLISAESIEEIICKRQIYKHHLAQKILIDPRQSKVHDWDSMFDLFRPPTRKVVGSGDTSDSTVLKKLLDLVVTEPTTSTPLATEEVESPDDDAFQSLITKVWNQDEIEMPRIASVLVDSAETEAAASRAIRTVLGEASTGTDITVPTWTGKSGGSVVAPARERSANLVSRLNSKTTFENEQLVVEKAVVRDLISFLKKRSDYSASTEQVLEAFTSRVSNGGQSEIFRSCLRQLCKFDQGCWVLKREHR